MFCVLPGTKNLQWYEIKYGIQYYLTEPRRALQPKGTQWFPLIGLFVVQAISLGPCRRLIEFLISSNSCGPKFQIHKVEKWKILSPFFIISHEQKRQFFEVIWQKQILRHMFPIPNMKYKRINRKNWTVHYCQISKVQFFKRPYFCRIDSGSKILSGQITSKNLSLCSWEITKTSLCQKGLKIFHFLTLWIWLFGIFDKHPQGCDEVKNSMVFYRDLDWWPGPQKVRFGEITGYP